MTRDEFRAAVGTVLDDALMSEDDRTDPGWVDTIMRCADQYVTHVVGEVLKPVPVDGEPC